MTNLVCPDTRCKKLIPEEDVRCLATDELYNKYIKFDLNNQVNNDDKLTWCPITECGAIARIRAGGMFGECTECEFRFCLTCHHFYHSGKRCPVLTIGAIAFQNMSKTVQEQFIADKLNDIYVNKYSKNCPSCNSSIMQTNGCNKMTCTTCGKYFCWICLKVILNYDHFSESPE